MGRGAIEATLDAPARHPRRGRLLRDDPWQIGFQLNDEPAQQQLRRLPRQLIIDMDDTLISNGILFRKSTEQLLNLFEGFDQQGRGRERLREILESIDDENLPQMGYTPARWHQSAQQAAELIASGNLRERDRARVRAAAESALGVGELLPGVEHSLVALRRAGVDMVLKTKGDRSKQRQKISAHGLVSFFGENRIIITDRKGKETFYDAASSRGFTAPVSIGDSRASDIAPALACGYEAILIAAPGHDPRWSDERDPLHPEVPVVTSFPAALQQLLDRFH